MKNRVLIFGITGQDGYHLTKKLLKLKYEVYGTSRKPSGVKNLEKRKILKNIKIFNSQINNSYNVDKIIREVSPKFIFNLVNVESLEDSDSNRINTYMNIFYGNLNILESIINNNQKIRFFSASSSEIYGLSLKGRITKNTKMKPINHYGFAKKNSYELIKYYREKYKLFCCSGILFNHESPIRSDKSFITNLIDQCILVKSNKISKLKIYNINSYFDWGWAPDYVDAIYKCLRMNKPKDYIIASGKTYSVKELIIKVIKRFDLNYQKNVKVITYSNDKRNKQKFTVDTSDMLKELNWKTDKSIDYIIDKMIYYRLKNSHIQISKPS